MIHYHAERPWSEQPKWGVWRACQILGQAHDHNDGVPGKWVCKLNRETLRTIANSHEELRDMMREETIDNFYGLSVVVDNRIPLGKAVMGTWTLELMIVDEVT
jgi:hypothetical protein